MTRQVTSKEILGVDWDYPVATTFAEERGTGHTFASRAKVAMPVADAFALIAGKDQRPLLVLRECTRCKGTEHALFARRLNNEKTQLLLNWFHCVKLPPETTDKNHPFHNLFARGGAMPHLFIAAADGSDRIDFDGSQPQSALQKELIKLIDGSYKKKPLPAIKSMLRFLSRFDMLDMREDTLLVQIDNAREAHGPDSSAAKKLTAKLEEVRREKAKAMKSAKAVCDLKLKIEVAAAK
jgi:hypothetical protein